MSNTHSAGRCRNCGHTGALVDLGFVGQVAPFFLQRVMGLRLGRARSSKRWKGLVRSVARWLQAWLEKIDPPMALVEMQICDACSFIQTRLPFHEDAINRLYTDYREDSYNRERIELEPQYAQWAGHVGHSPVELESRLSAATTFLKRSVPVEEGFTILDFGGSDGKFVPRLEAQKYVFEISKVEPVPGVTRVHSAAELGTYSLVQLAHVVEHVVEPLGLVQHVASHVAQGGFLYVETPQEIPERERTALRQGRRMVGVHEHINSYSVEAVRHLIQNAGLRLVDIEATPVDVGWGKATHIRALGQKS